MLRSISKLPSPRLLIIFEAAARLQSFTRAAQELNMQQPSVSSAIKQLEETVGVVLFKREHRKIDLTISGKRLFFDISMPLQDIEEALTSVQQSGRQGYVTLSTSSAFSYYWMMPRLAHLREAHPDIDLRLQNSDRDPDLDMENLSLGIRIGNGNWRGYFAVKIADEIIYPVASPQVMSAAKNLRSIPNLMHERLIHLEEPIRNRPVWSQWFAHHGIAQMGNSGGLRLNDYALVLQAAVSGEGFAFGWDHVVRNLIDRKTLAARPEWAWRTGNGVYLVWSNRQPLSAQATEVRDWMISVSDFPNGAG